MYNRIYDLHRRHESRQGLSLRREALECHRPALRYALREDHPGHPRRVPARLPRGRDFAHGRVLRVLHRLSEGHPPDPSGGSHLPDEQRSRSRHQCCH